MKEVSYHISLGSVTILVYIENIISLFELSKCTVLCRCWFMYYTRYCSTAIKFLQVLKSSYFTCKLLLGLAIYLSRCLRTFRLTKITLFSYHLAKTPWWLWCIVVSTLVYTIRFTARGGGTYYTIPIELPRGSEQVKSTETSNLRLSFVNHYDIITCCLFLPSTN